MKPQSSGAGAERRPQARADNQAGNRRPGRSCPPYNPALRKLVDGKRAWAEPLDDEARARGFLGWHQRGYLPHYDVPGVMQLVTFRL